MTGGTYSIQRTVALDLDFDADDEADARAQEAEVFAELCALLGDLRDGGETVYSIGEIDVTVTAFTPDADE